MHPVFAAPDGAVPIHLVTAASWPGLRGRLEPAQAKFADAAGFEPKAGRLLLLPGSDGLAGALFALDGEDTPGRDPFLTGKLPTLLPAGVYRFADGAGGAGDLRIAALAFALGAYRFARYRKPDDKAVRLAVPAGVDGDDLSRVVEAVYLARDLVNTPTNDMGPEQLETAARALAERHGAKASSIIGGDLLANRLYLIHAVGRAAAQAPRLIELTWGDPADPAVTLVGKGVCFDSGGLDIKPSSAMLIMKKDMGGAATVLALAHMIMSRGLKVRLRVLIPAVENAVGGDAFRPLDVYPSRKGLTVEIGNTDAEGRLVLADALAVADEAAPDLLIDMGTLTGAARVAVGPELVPLYTDDEALAQDVLRHARAENDPLWRMPLWPPYKSMLESKVADINNAPASSFAGSITCALFLQRFVTATKSWLHFDIYAWNPSTRPGRPEGGECQAARALYAYLCDRYGG
ncbi:MAG TPA: leucyl aminopeptidase family protein [Xanthobacteraceae bacterium]|nr:leucyl aminopeptidase family protein [Xanthobacteraceae bacterium]